jgi:HlyD family secretion protein
MRPGLLLGLLWGALGCGLRDDAVIVASGTIEATEADLGFQTGGRIDSILVREGQRVTEGQRLAVLDRRELVARQGAAEAALAAQRARLAELERGFRPEEIAQARAALRGADQRVSDAERDRSRARNLFEGGAISRQALDREETALLLAEAEQDRVREQLRLLEAGPRAEQVAAQRAAVEQAAAALEQAATLLAYAEVRAPFPGLVVRRHREPGEIVALGLPVVSVSNPDDRWVRIYLPLEAAGRARLGQRAEIVMDSYPDRRYEGEVVFIADEAEFTPRNVQTREERVKLVYRLRVRIVGDTALDLKPGMPADVTLRDAP